MKKTTALLLALLLCAALCACGDGTGDTEPTPAPSESTGLIYGAEGSAFSEHPLLEQCWGEWNFVYFGGIGEYPAYSSLILNEDGTCILDGEPANWKIEDHETKEDVLFLGIYQNDVSVYGAYISFNSWDTLVMCPYYGGDYYWPENAYLTQFSANAGYIKDSTGRIVLKPETFQRYLTFVEVTPENWRDYFTVEVTEVETTNAFGDVTGSFRRCVIKVADLGQCYSLWCNPVNENSSNYVVVEMQDNATGYTWIDQTSNDILYSRDAYSEEDVLTLESIELLRVQGFLVLVTVPEEYWSEYEGTTGIYLMDGEGNQCEINLTNNYSYNLHTLLLSMVEG